ncbi:hypothetical protein V8G56_08385 [Gaetbulibacter aquiaggeris]|uniref:Secreted protein n=1 Tax=Gaetbulibacter aquiaggeris TaxID=1735373 RepID=A0ABW7MQ79_9FLAO
MKIVFQKIMALLMSLVVLFSTMSFTIDMHYCGDILVETAIFHKAKGCGMEMEDSAANSECSTIKKGCCKEEQIIVQGQDELQLTFDKLTFEKQFFVSSLLYTYVSLFESEGESIISFLEYPPPLIVKKLYKLDETYLI